MRTSRTSTRTRRPGANRTETRAQRQAREVADFQRLEALRAGVAALADLVDKAAAARWSDGRTSIELEQAMADQLGHVIVTYNERGPGRAPS